MFKTSNSQYGEQWVSVTAKADRDPAVHEDVPLYSEIGQRQAMLTNSLRTYKHELLKEMREQGELDGDVVKAMKERKEDMRRPGIVPREYPVQEMEEMKYPEPALKSSNPLYRTSNNSYGSMKPSAYEKPDKFFPKDNTFTKGFLGGTTVDTGLNTFKTPSRVHKAYDC